MEICIACSSNDLEMLDSFTSTFLWCFILPMCDFEYRGTNKGCEVNYRVN